jgi:hypothetical protein
VVVAPVVRPPVVAPVVVVAPRPTVIGRTPAANAARVNRLVNVSARFSRGVSGVSASRFYLRNTVTGALVRAVVTYDPRTKIAYLNPVSTLRSNTVYTVILTSGIRAADGQSIPTTSWRFRTGV